MFMTGIAIFATASLLGGLATTEAWLIVTRGLQGAGAAIAAPTAFDRADQRHRHHARLHHRI